MRAIKNLLMVILALMVARSDRIIVKILRATTGTHPITIYYGPEIPDEKILSDEIPSKYGKGAIEYIYVGQKILLNNYPHFVQNTFVCFNFNNVQQTDSSSLYAYADDKSMKSYNDALAQDEENDDLVKDFTDPGVLTFEQRNGSSEANMNYFVRFNMDFTKKGMLAEGNKGKNRIVL